MMAGNHVRCDFRYLLALELCLSLLVFFTGSCGAQQVVTAKDLQRATSELARIDSTAPGAVNRNLVFVTVAPNIKSSDLKALSLIIEPYTIHAVAGDTLSKILNQEFGTTRPDLLQIVEELNPVLFATLRSKIADFSHIALEENTPVVLPNLPLRTNTATVIADGTVTLWQLAKQYYPPFYQPLEQMLQANPSVSTVRDPVYGEIRLPQIPVGREVQLRQGGTDVKENEPLSDNSFMLVSALALNQKKNSIAARPVLNASIEQPVSFTLSGADENCGSDSGDWFLEQVAADKILDSDLGHNYTPVIVVIDSGVDRDHRDFPTDIFWWGYENPSGTPDVTSGQARGFDLTSDDSEFPIDHNLHSHGTHVAGLAAGRHLATLLNLRHPGQPLNLPQPNLLVIKVADITADTTETNIAKALTLAFQKGGQIYNLSLTTGISTILEYIFNSDSQDHMFVVAAGNGAKISDNPITYKPLDLSDGLFFPAFLNSKLLTFKSTLIVAAITRGGAPAQFSNYGASKVQIGAPGVCILSSVRSDISPDGYSWLSGTSQAAPLVTLTAALLKAKHSHLPFYLIKRRILASCDWLPDAETFIENGCELNMAKALATTVDVVELRSGTLLRGTVQDASLMWRKAGSNKSDNLSLFATDGLRKYDRLWFGYRSTDPQSTLQDGVRTEGSFDEQNIHFTLAPPAKCPYEVSGGDCIISTKDIRDIVFRTRNADHDR